MAAALALAATALALAATGAGALAAAALAADVRAEGLGATLQDRSKLAGTRGSHNDAALAS